MDGHLHHCHRSDDAVMCLSRIFHWRQTAAPSAVEEKPSTRAYQYLKSHITLDYEAMSTSKMQSMYSMYKQQYYGEDTGRCRHGMFLLDYSSQATRITDNKKKQKRKRCKNTARETQILQIDRTAESLLGV